MFQKNLFYQSLLSAIAGLIITGAVILAWTEPSQAPPGGNVAAPINVGSASQTKSGALTVTTLTTSAGKLYLDDATEGDIERVNAVIGYNDLFLKSNSAENAPIYLAGSQLSFYSGGTERWRIDSGGSLAIGSVPWPRLTSFPSDCPSGQYVSGIGGTLKCSTPPATGGTVTSISASGGITASPNPITTTGSLSLTYPSKSCSSGAIQSFNLGSGAAPTCVATGLTSESDPVWVSWRDNQNRSLSGNLWIGGTVIASGWFASPYNTDLTVDAGWGSPNTLTLYDTVKIPNGSLTVSGSGSFADLYSKRLYLTGRSGGATWLAIGDELTDDWLRINRNESFGGIALYKSVAMGSGGLAIGSWTRMPTGQLYVSDRVGIGKTNPGAKLDIAGGDINMDGGTTIYSRGRMHIFGEELLYFLNRSGVIVSKAWGGNGNLTAEGRVLVGTGAASTDDTLYVNGGIYTNKHISFQRIGVDGDALFTIDPSKKYFTLQGIWDTSGARSLISPVFRAPSWIDGNLPAFQIYHKYSDNPNDWSGRVIWGVRVNGNTFTLGGYETGNVDIAEYMPAVENLEPGDVVVFDEATGRLRRSFRAYDSLAAGVISTNPGFVLGADDEDLDWGEKDLGDSLAANLLEEIIKTEKKTQKAALALSGRVPAKVDATKEAIKIGDILVTSDTPGYAMKADPDKIKEGMVIGRALQSLEKGEKGVILILVK